MPKETLRDSKRTHSQKMQREKHHHHGDHQMSELGLLLMSKLPTGEAGLAGRRSEHNTSCSGGNPEVCRTPRGDKCPPKTIFNNEGCPEPFWRPPRDDRRAVITLSCNDGRPKASQKPAPCNEPPVMPLSSNEGRPETSQKPAPCNELPVISLPSKGGHSEAFQRPCDRRPVSTISANEGGVGASQKPTCGSKHPVHTLHNKDVCPEASGTPQLSPSRPVRNLACNGTPPEIFRKSSCGDRLGKTLSSKKGHPVASKKTVRVDKRPANTTSNTKAHPRAFQTPRSDRRPVHTISRTQCADRHPKTTLSSNVGHPGASGTPRCGDKHSVITLSSNEGRHGTSGTPQCDDKHPVIALSCNEGRLEASQKALHGHSNDRRPMNTTSCNEWSLQASRKPRSVHTTYSNEECTDYSRAPCSDGRPVQTLLNKEGCPEAAHKRGDQRPVSTIPSSDGCPGDYTAGGETQHVKIQTTEASAAPQDAPATTNLTDSGDQSDETCKFWSVPSKFRWIFRYPKFQRNLQRSYMVETWFSGAKKGLFIKGEREDVIACTRYLKMMLAQWRQRDRQCADGGAL